MATTLEQTGAEARAGIGPARARAGVDWPALLPTAGAALLLLVLARPVFHFWYWEWMKPESYYAHAPIIPVLAGVMLWHRREALRRVALRPCWGTLALIAPALAMLVVSTKQEMQAVESASFLLALTGGVWLVCGTALVRAAAFPLLFLWLMAPLPGPVLNDATLHIQMLSTVLANKILHLMTFGTTLDGNVIHMDNFTLFVDVPCSGFKLLLSFLTFSAAFAYLLDGAPRRRLALFLLSLPLSVLVNGVRIALIGVVGECVGSGAAHVFHDWSGLITLVLGFTALFSLAKVFGCRKLAGLPLF